MSNNDIIVAPATATAPAALAVVRLSGAGLAELAERLLRRMDGTAIVLKPGRALRALVVNLSGEAIDDGVIVWRQHPHSYTGEDLLELTLHGGPAIVAGVMDAVCALGARPALPGEFTWRALANGRMDWREAGAVAALSNARTRAQLLTARNRLTEGALWLEELAGAFARAEAAIETIIELGEEDPPRGLLEVREKRLCEMETHLQEFLRRVEEGRAVFCGWMVVFAGAVNAGKSSLFNALLGRERALVSPTPGTTRDVVEATLCADPPVTLADGAGAMHSPDSELTSAAMGLARKAQEHADLILFCREAGTVMEQVLIPEGVEVWQVTTKSDLHETAAEQAGFVTSCQTGQGIAELKQALLLWARAREAQGEGLFLLPEEVEAIEQAATTAQGIRQLLAEGADELAAHALHEARSHLRFGPDPGAPVSGIEELMAGFCLGK